MGHPRKRIRNLPYCISDLYDTHLVTSISCDQEIGNHEDLVRHSCVAAVRRHLRRTAAAAGLHSELRRQHSQRPSYSNSNRISWRRPDLCHRSLVSWEKVRNSISLSLKLPCPQPSPVPYLVRGFTCHSQAVFLLFIPLQKGSRLLV